MSLPIPEKCKNCIHRINDYCKGYGAKIEILITEMCLREKSIKSRKERRKIKYDGIITRVTRCKKN